MTLIGDILDQFRDANLRRALAIVLVSGGGVAVAVQVANRSISKKIAADEKKMSPFDASTSKAVGGAKRGKGESSRGINALFFERIRRILAIIVPGVDSPEFIVVALLGALLIARTALSVVITEIIGINAQSVVSRNWKALSLGLVRFALITIPAAVVNSGLKYCSSLLSLMWRTRLSEHVHKVYLRDVNFYKACNLGGQDRIDNADQRVTADIVQFSEELADLYTTVFKPCLDIVLFTGKLAEFIGWQAPFILYGYFAVSGFIKRAIMPKFGRYIAYESQLEGTYRTCHNRLIVNAEEIAFYKGADKERAIITTALSALVRHSRRTRFLKFLVGIFDQLLVKYWASIAGYLALIYPIVYPPTAALAARGTAELTRDYIRTSQYLTALSTAVGDLILSFNNLVNISGYTARVSELLEMVIKLEHLGSAPFVVREDASSESAAVSSGIDSTDQAAIAADAAAASQGRRDAWRETVTAWRIRCDERDAKQAAPLSAAVKQLPGGGKIERSDSISLQDVDLVSPDGKLLVKSLTCEIKRGVNCMVTGPNGSGKSSLFRVIGELWPLHCGTLRKPDSSRILFVPQKPYLVIGSLRDQIIYPHTVQQMKAGGTTDDDLARLLALVDPAGLILKEWRWDDTRDWWQALSGGQKQRVAMARLFYHRPAYAILDECTSAVSDEVEDTLYQTCQLLGVTLFTVSHRKSLRRHHDFQLAFEGGMAGKWSWTKIDKDDLNTPMTSLVL